MAGQRGSDAASDLKDWLELPTQQREMQSRDTGLASLDRSLTPVTTSLQAALAEQDSRFAEQHSPDGPLSRSALAPDVSWYTLV